MDQIDDLEAVCVPVVFPGVHLAEEFEHCAVHLGCLLEKIRYGSRMALRHSLEVLGGTSAVAAQVADHVPAVVMMPRQLSVSVFCITLTSE